MACVTRVSDGATRHVDLCRCGPRPLCLRANVSFIQYYLLISSSAIHFG